MFSKTVSIYMLFMFFHTQGPTVIGFKLLWCPRLSVFVFVQYVSFVQPQNVRLVHLLLVCVVYIYARFLNEFPIFQILALNLSWSAFYLPPPPDQVLCQVAMSMTPTSISISILLLRRFIKKHIIGTRR